MDHKHGFIGLIILMVVLQTIPSSQVWAVTGEDSSEDSADRLYRFAEKLFNSGDYYRAITEYKRFISYHPNDFRRDYSSFRIGMSYYNSNHLDEASAHFFSFLREYPDSDFRQAAWFYGADAFFQMGDWIVANDEFRRIERTESASGLKDIAILRQAWINAMQYQWDEAADLMLNLSKKESVVPLLDLLETECRKGESLPSRSPVFAGILSAVVPGTGQMYAGRYVDGTVALLLNAAFIWGAIEAFDNDNPTAGGILLFFELGWYTGNIYSAINSSHRFNRKHNQAHVTHLQDSFPDLYRSDRILFLFNIKVP
jgi:tetratricopeptide (TPR) repeat protein